MTFHSQSSRAWGAYGLSGATLLGSALAFLWTGVGLLGWPLPKGLFHSVAW